MKKIILALVLLSGATLGVKNCYSVEQYSEYVENEDGDITNEKHIYTTVEDANGNVLFTIDYDETSEDVTVLY